MKTRFLSLVIALLAVTLYYNHVQLLGHHGQAAQSVAIPSATASPYEAGTLADPAHWARCSTIPYELNLAGAPSYARRDLDAAMAKISAATHLRFRFVGDTTTVPQANWGESTTATGYQPVLIAFADPSATSALDAADSTELGVTYPSSIQTATGLVYVSGTIVINSTGHLAEGFGVGTRLGSLFLHELGHLVGLAHSPDPRSFMYPYLGVTDQVITPTDAAHLAALGAPTGC
jgi:hypothetical protein